MMNAMNLKDVRLAPASGAAVRDGGRPEGRPEESWI